MTSRPVEITAADGGRFPGSLTLPRSGSGPGILLLQETLGVDAPLRAVADLYAEEGYVVLAPDIDVALADIEAALMALRRAPECRGKVGALGFGLGGRLAYVAAARGHVDAAVSYYGTGLEPLRSEANALRCPMVFHFPELDRHLPTPARDAIVAALGGREDVQCFLYPGVDHGFDLPERATFDKPATLMAHSRSLALFRRVLGPSYDLPALWERHTALEFATRDARATIATMVAEPYVNHIPTMTGGVGHDELYRFYANHFIPKTPADTKLVPISRTVGVDRLVDEMLFCFTHDIEIDWMLPGIPPTGRYVEIPLVAIVRFRGDKLYNEHIYWDQASVLVQIGLLDPEGLPVAGVETAKKLVDESLPSNTLMARWQERAR
jgi:carboxymethylenebutenolidase